MIGGDGDKEKDKDKDGKEDGKWQHMDWRNYTRLHFLTFFLQLHLCTYADLYQGGIGKQLLHTVSDAAIDRLSYEAQKGSDIGGSLGDVAIKAISSKVKHVVHEKINGVGEEDKPKEEHPEQPPAHEGEPVPPAHEGEPAPMPEPITVASPAEEKKGGLAGLFDKFTRRR